LPEARCKQRPNKIAVPEKHPMKKLFTKAAWNTRRALGAIAALATVTVVATLAACGGSGGDGPATQQSIRHVFVLTMENKNFTDSFGTSTQDPYLKALATQGAMLNQYYGTGHVSLDNYVAMMSGQPSTIDTETDCTQGFNDIVAVGTDAANPKVVKAQNGKGCVYPAAVKTFANQLDDVGATWKGYMGDMGNDPAREAATCAHPKIGAIDNTQSAQAPTADVPKGDQSHPTCAMTGTTATARARPARAASTARPAA
jgi:hypothetical protein